MILDYHMHLRSPREEIDHTVTAVERFVEVAAARGVEELAFTEHVYYFRQTRDFWTLPYQLERCVYDLDVYCDAVLEAKRRGLPVKLGLEVDYVGERTQELGDLLAQYPLDLRLGSVHWIDGLAVDLDPGIWAERSVEEVWRLYFDALAGAAASGVFDVLSHPDLVKIFDRRPDPRAIVELQDAAAQAIAASGVCLEISSAGLHKRVGELYPDRRLLEACRARKVPITLASDAHVPEHVGRDLDRCLDLARRAGYETVTVFERRRSRQEALFGPSNVLTW